MIYLTLHDYKTSLPSKNNDKRTVVFEWMYKPYINYEIGMFEDIIENESIEVL